MSQSVTCTKSVSRIFAVSTENGIFVSANAFNEDEQPMSAFVTRDAEGNIVGKIVNESLTSAHDEWKENNSAQFDFVNKYTTFFQILFSLIVAAIAMIKNTNITIIFSLLWLISLFTSSLYNASYYCAILIYNKIKAPAIARYHAAEHMAYHAFNEYNRVPTMNEISQQTMYEYKCATTDSLIVPTAVSLMRTFIIAFSVFFIGIGVQYLLKTWAYSWPYNFIFLIFAAIVAIVSKILKCVPAFVTKQLKKEQSFLKFFQWAVVSTPRKDEIEVAQMAIKIRTLMDETIKEDPEGYMFEDVSFDLLNKKAIYTFHNGKTGRTTLIEYINSVMNILNAKIEKDKSDSSQNNEEDEDDEADEVTVQTVYFNDEEPTEAKI